MRSHILSRAVVLSLALALIIAACGGGATEPGGSATDVPSDAAPTEGTVTQPAAPPTDADAAAPAAEAALGGAVCCEVHGEINGESYLFVMTLGSGSPSGPGMLHVLQNDGDGAFQEVGSIETPVGLMPASLAPASRIALAGEVLYLPLPGEGESGGLWVVDVSNPASPEEMALVETELSPLSVAVTDDLAAVATMSFSGPLLLFDISDPGSPHRVSEQAYSVTSMPPGIAVANSLLYVFDESGVAIIDASRPDAPREAGTYPNPDWSGQEGEESTGGRTELLEGLAPSDAFVDIAAAGQYLYIAASDGGLLVIDVSDPANPREAGHLELPDRAVGVAASDNRVYVLGVERTEESLPLRYTVHVVDASDAGDPRPVETIAVPDATQPFQSLISGDNAIFLVGLSTVHMIDTSGSE